jgi:type VI secretion system secreted protein Hcp
MAVDAYMAFQQYQGTKWLEGESQVDFKNNKEILMKSPVSLEGFDTQRQIFEVDDFSFDIEQTLNIGSQARGAGAGKVTFNPFSITRKIDKCSPIFYQMACSGTPFQWVVLALRKSSGSQTSTTGTGAASGQIYLRFDFKLVAVKTISWSYDDESPKEEVTMEYGALMVNYSIQGAKGEMLAPIYGGWNRVTNTQDTSSTPIPAT